MVFNVFTAIGFSYLPVIKPCMLALINTYTSGGWPTVAVTTAETYHSLSSHALFGLHHCSGRIDECQWVPSFFQMEELSNAPLFHMHLHVNCHCIRVPPYCHQSRGNENICGMVQPLLQYLHHLYLMLWYNIIKLGALLLEQPSLLRLCFLSKYAS